MDRCLRRWLGLSRRLASAAAYTKGAASDSDGRGPASRFAHLDAPIAAHFARGVRGRVDEGAGAARPPHGGLDSAGMLAFVLALNNEQNLYLAFPGTGG